MLAPNAASSPSPSPTRSSRRDSFVAHARPRGSSLSERCEPLVEWMDRRLSDRTWSFCRTLLDRGPVFASVATVDGRQTQGLNFASQDYLGLTFDPRVREAAARALHDHGPHSAGSEVNGGNTLLTRELEAAIGDFLELPHVALFPTGWAAGYAALRGTLRQYDHVIVDALAHNCLQEGILASGAQRHAVGHNDLEAIAAALREIRGLARPDAAVMVVSESLFSMDSDGPDLARLVELVREHGAHLAVDVAHDLGVLGPGGRGLLAEAGVLSAVDFVIGSFSKVFGSTGGFVATPHRSCLLHIQAFGQANTFSNSLGPVNTASVLAALGIVRCSDGDLLRSRVLDAATRLREACQGRSFEILGRPSALVPVLIGDEHLGRLLCREAGELGVLSNFIEYPAVPVGRSRLRLQVTPAHAALALDEVAAHLDRARLNATMAVTGA